LLAQGEVLDGELAVATAEEGEEAKQVEQRADHGSVIVLGSAAKDQALAWRTEFWRRTARAGPASALMKLTVAKLTMDDMISLAAYAASLEP